MIKKILILLSFLILIIGCSQSTTDKTVKATGKVYTVVLSNNQFNPGELTIGKGDAVEWVNNDSSRHTVTFEDARMDIILGPNEKRKNLFIGREEARYFCKLHSGMKGTIIVK